MAGELTKGLNVLLHPKFTELQQRLDRLEALHKDLTAVVALKEERQEVDHLRDHVASQIKHVDHIIEMNRDKMLSLDELRSREIRALTKSMEQKATLVNVNHLTEQLHQTNVALATKSEVGKVEQLSKQYHALSEEVALKATGARAEELGKQLQVLHDTLARKVDSETTDRLMDKIKSVAADVALRAEASKLTDTCRKLDALAEECAQKAEIVTAEQLSRQIQALREDVEQRAAVRQTDHLGRQIQHLAEEMQQKSEASTSEQAIRQIHALSEALAQKTENQAHTVLNDQVNKLREDILAIKAETCRLDEHGRQLEALSSTVSVNTSRVKHLSLMYANNATGGGINKESTASSPSASPMPGMKPKLPPMTAATAHQTFGAQKPGMVTLPSMAHPPQSAR